MATNPGQGFAAGVEDAIYYAAVFGGTVWVLEMARITAAMDRAGPQLWVGWCGVALLGAAVLAIALTRRIGLLAFLLTLLGAILAIAVINVDDGQSILKPIYAATSPALLIPAAFALKRWSVGLICAAGAILLCELTIVVPGTSLTWSRSFFVVIWSAVLGLFVWWLISALREAAAKADDSNAASLLAKREQADTRARARETARLGRLLHDTLINTMGAIRDGVADALPVQLRDRCRADLAQLLSARAAGRSPGGLTADSVERLVEQCDELARVRGITLIVNATGTQTKIPADILDHARDICGEALTNVIKHAGVDQCTLTVRASVGDLELELRDGGRGFDPAVVRASGIESSMRARALEAGLGFELDAKPDSGTTIRLWWRETARGSGEAPELREHPVFPLRGGWMLWLLWGLTMLQAVVQAPGQSLANITLYVSAALAMGIALLAALRDTRVRGAVGPAGGLCLIVAGAYGAWASSTGQALCSPNPEIWVGSTAVLVAIAVLAVVSQQIWWLLGAWVAGLGVLTVVAIAGAGPGCSALVTVLDGSEVIAFVLGVVFVWASVRAQRRVNHAQQRLEKASTAVAIERARASRYERRLDVAAQIAVPLFEGIVSGQRDARAPDTRAVAAQQEIILRSIAQLPDLPDETDRLFLELLTAADRSGLAMKLVFTGSQPEALAALARSGVFTVCFDVVGALEPGDRVTINVVASEVTREVRLAADTSGPRDVHLTPTEGLSISSVMTDDQIALIANW